MGFREQINCESIASSGDVIWWSGRHDFHEFLPRNASWKKRVEIFACLRKIKSSLPKVSFQFTFPSFSLSGLQSRKFDGNPNRKNCFVCRININNFYSTRSSYLLCGNWGRKRSIGGNSICLINFSCCDGKNVNDDDSIELDETISLEIVKCFEA